MKNLSLGHYWLAVISVALCIFIYLYFQGRAEQVELREIQAELAALLQSETPPKPSTEPLPTPEKSPNPHAEAIAQVDTDTGLQLSALAKRILREEGERSRPYLDRAQNPTIGVGRNLKGNGISVAELQAIVEEIDYDVVLRETDIENGRVRIPTLPLAHQIFVKPLTAHDIQLLLANDLKNVENEAISVFGASLWGKIGEPRKEAILDVLFNLGLPHFKTFVKFIGAVKTENWDVAASELLLSEAARANITRFHYAAVVIKTGQRVR